MATTVEQVVNQALMLAGKPQRIADIYEGSESAVIALELYAQARDELQREREWSFQRKVAALTLLKGPPPAGGYSSNTPWSNIYPNPGFLYEYAYPLDCLDLRAIIAPPLGGMPDLDPLAALFRVDNDPTPVVSGNPPTASGPAAKVIFCNVTNAMGVYRASITNPVLWQPDYVKALVQSLAEKFAKAKGEPIAEEQVEEQKTARVTEQAAEARG